MAEHTPGPWRADLAGPWQAGGDWIGVVAVTETEDGGWQVRREICTVMADTDDSEEFARDKADARLIAASPRLLAACRLVLDRFGAAVMTDPEDPEQLRDLGVILEVTAAVADATGETA